MGIKSANDKRAIRGGLLVGQSDALMLLLPKMTRNEFTRLTDRRTILTSRTPNPVRPVRRDVRFSRDRTFGFWILCPWMESCSSGPGVAGKVMQEWVQRNSWEEKNRAEKRRRKREKKKKRRNEKKRKDEKRKKRKKCRRKRGKRSSAVYRTGNYGPLPMFRSDFIAGLSPFDDYIVPHGFVSPIQISIPRIMPRSIRF